MYALGIDIGSTTSKSILLNREKEIIATSIVLAGTGTIGPKEALRQVLETAGISERDISYCVATGYGRNLFFAAQEEISELSCHAKGVHWMYPDVRTIIDIGGQDAKALALNEDGRLVNFIMNDKCAAGTGRFLDVMAHILGLEIGSLEVEAAKSVLPAKISNTCTVFAESEVISQLSCGTPISDLVAGICQSVACKAASLVKRIGVTEKVYMSGGVARNGGVRVALETELGVSIEYSSMAQLAGALGAALYAHEKIK